MADGSRLCGVKCVCVCMCGELVISMKLKVDHFKKTDKKEKSKHTAYTIHRINNNVIHAIFRFFFLSFFAAAAVVPPFNTILCTMYGVE